MGAEKAQLSKLADEYNAMDAEDTVGGVRTRFRYREVCAYKCMHHSWLYIWHLLENLKIDIQIELRLPYTW